MRDRDNTLLTQAVRGLQSDLPRAEELTASATKIAQRLGIEIREEVAGIVTANCEDVRRSLHAYKRGTLSNTQASLIEMHMRQCAGCTQTFGSGSAIKTVDWSRPSQARLRIWKPRTFGWAFAVVFSLLVCGLFLYRSFWEVPPGVRAEVQSIDGSAYLVSGSQERSLSPGNKLDEGTQLRTASGSRAVLRLSDGSTVEVGERTSLGLSARGRNMTVSLNGGAVIVQAAQRSSGHLYVRTSDCRVAVTGTLFSVNSGIKGSRVAVLRGNVEVAHAGVETQLQAGEQLATSGSLAPVPLEQEVAWSQDRDQHLQLIAELATLQHRIGQIALPQPAYHSDLLSRVPADTMLYISIPNLGDFLSQANAIFHDQLSNSPALQQWWNRGHGNNTEELDALVDKLHRVSEYLGNEMVVVGLRRADRSSFAILADVEKDGLNTALKSLVSNQTSMGSIVVLDEPALNALPNTASSSHAAYALLLPHEAILSNDVTMLKTVDAQFNAGASGFAAGEFGKQIAAAYSRGAGIILAADIHSMLDQSQQRLSASHPAGRALEESGLEDVRYLIAEHREGNGAPENHLNVEFAGERQRVASWLAEPGPMRSLEFVSPHASLVAAALSKDPSKIADDLTSMTTAESGHSNTQSNPADAELKATIHDELIANLGSEFLLTLDGPVLPTPSWKGVIEVRDPDRIEAALEHLASLIDNQEQSKSSHRISIEPTDSNGQRFYAIHDLSSGAVVAQYTFSNGYMLIARATPGVNRRSTNICQR